MKTRIMVSVIILCITARFSFAQTITMVTPGDGTLAAAIAAAASGDILQLTGGAVYTHTSSDIAKAVIIEVAPGASQKAIIRLSESASPASSYYFFVVKNGGALMLRGLEIHGLLGGVPVAKDMIRFDGRPDPNVSKIGTFRFEDCVFHDFTQRIVDGMIEANGRGLIQDSVFIDNVVVYNAEHCLQYKHVNLRHLEMKNSTMYKLQGEALKIGKIGYRSILVGSGKPYIALYDSTITPTGFIDHCTLNDMGDIHGHIQVDDAFHMFTISNCLITNQDRMIGHPLLNPLTTLQPAVYFMDARPDTAVYIRNTCFWKCAPPDYVFGPNQWPGYAFHDTISMDPAYRDTAIGDFTLPAGSPLLTFGTDGGPIGDPRWAGKGTTKVGQQEYLNPSNVFFSQNYPNPFNPSTTIQYGLPWRSRVVVKVFSLLGQEMKTLINDVQSAGYQRILWNGRDNNGIQASSGVYFFRIIADPVDGTGESFIQTSKMLLMK